MCNLSFPVFNWGGWSHGADFSGNTVDIAGTGRYGHEIWRNPDGTYEIGSGWGGATGIWMLRLFRRQFGEAPRLDESRVSATE